MQPIGAIVRGLVSEIEAEIGIPPGSISIADGLTGEERARYWRKLCREVLQHDCGHCKQRTECEGERE